MGNPVLLHLRIANFLTAVSTGLYCISFTWELSVESVKLYPTFEPEPELLVQVQIHGLAELVELGILGI